MRTAATEPAKQLHLMGPKAGLDTLQREKNIPPLLGIKPRFLGPAANNPVTTLW
jgi:hypothetical protein